MLVPVKIERLTSFQGHKGAVYSLLGAPSGKTFYSGGGDHIVAEWKLDGSGEGKPFAEIPGIIYSLALSPDGNLLLVGQDSGGIHVINIKEKKEEHLLQYHRAPVFDLLISPVNELIFSLAGNGMLGVSFLNDFSLIQNIKLSENKLRSVSLNNNDSQVAIGTGDGVIYIFSLPDMNIIKKWQAHKTGFSVNALKFSPDGKHLLSGSRDAHLNIYDTTNFELEKSFPAHNYAIYSIVCNPDNSLIATGSRDKTIKIWNADNFEMLIRLDKENFMGHINSVNKLLWHSSSGKLISGGDDRTVMVWDVQFESLKFKV
jgi:WD repeat-containing protein 61